MLRIGIRWLLMLFAGVLLLILAAVFAGKIRYAPVLTFIATQNDASDIFLLDSSTRQRFNLTDTPDFDEVSFAWSPDGERIVSAVSIEKYEALFLRDGNGQNPTPITNLPTRQAFNLRWSPDGQHLAYYSNYPNVSELYLISLLDNTVTNLTNTPDEPESYPEWSPDGGHLLYYMQNDFYLMDVENGTRIQLTDTTTREELPVWSPDGSRIVFQRFREFSGERQLFVLNLADGKTKHLDRVFEPRPQAVSWSPDSVSFVVGLDSQQIVIVDATSGVVRAITDSSQRASSPAWSPDGRYIAYLENQEIKLFDLRTEHTLSLTNGSAFRIQPPLIWKP